MEVPRYITLDGSEPNAGLIYVKMELKLKTGRMMSIYSRIRDIAWNLGPHLMYIKQRCAAEL